MWERELSRVLYHVAFRVPIIPMLGITKTKGPGEAYFLIWQEAGEQGPTTRVARRQ